MTADADRNKERLQVYVEEYWIKGHLGRLEADIALRLRRAEPGGATRLRGDQGAPGEPRRAPRDVNVIDCYRKVTEGYEAEFDHVEETVKSTLRRCA